jgi:DNA polymerase-3 subunit epsilon
MMRELDAIDYQVCPTDLEAEITEVRLIHAHRPRYNRRSRPPKTSHFVKLTREAFPRLSVVRTIKEDGLAYLGPFRSKKAADLVMTAIWDSVPIRRCRTRPGSRTGTCSAAQLGVAMCPCDGSLSEGDYREVVLDLVEGMNRRPEILLTPLEKKMHVLSENQRYEEAGWLRDRHDALARSIEVKQRWNSLVGGGVWEAETNDGSFALIDHGRLLATWDRGESPPLRPITTTEASHPEVPPNVETAEETRLVWRWLERSDLRLVNSTGALSIPARAARPLASSRRPGLG